MLLHCPVCLFLYSVAFADCAFCFHKMASNVDNLFVATDMWFQFCVPVNVYVRVPVCVSHTVPPLIDPSLSLMRATMECGCGIRKISTLLHASLHCAASPPCIREGWRSPPPRQSSWGGAGIYHLPTKTGTGWGGGRGKWKQKIITKKCLSGIPLPALLLKRIAASPSAAGSQVYYIKRETFSFKKDM